MSADELRAGFSRLAADVVPMEDPHGRLMLRRRKRFRGRVASLAAVTAALLAGGMAAPSALLNLGAPSGPGSDVTENVQVMAGVDYLERLITAPLRGNLSRDPEKIAEVEKAFSGYEPKFLGAGVKEGRLVFLNQTEQMLQVVVIFTGGDQPIALAKGIGIRSPIKDLISDPNGGTPLPVTPFLVMPVGDNFGKIRSVVGLAPPGCAIEHSAKGGFTGDGSWVRSYTPEPTGDYVVRDSRAVSELWRVSCDGKVREVRTADDYLDTSSVNQSASVMYERVMRFGAMAPTDGMIQWKGALPGFKSQATLISSHPRPGPAMLVIGPFTKAVLATDVRENQAVPTPTPSPITVDADQEWPMVSLGVAAEGVSAVRIPQAYAGQTLLSDLVLVYTDTNAVRVEAIDPGQQLVGTAPLREGIAMLTFSPGLVFEIRAVTAAGAPRASVRLVEQANGSRLLGDRLFKDW